MRSPATAVIFAAQARIAFIVTSSMVKPRVTAKRTARSSRSGSSSKFFASIMRTMRRAMSCAPPWGSRSSPVARSTAIALMVKSRRLSDDSGEKS